MRKLILLIILSIGINCHSQNLTFDELLEIRKKNFATAEEYLTSKGWSFMGSESPTYNKMGRLSFAYGKSEFDDKAQSFINIISNNKDSNRLVVQVSSEAKYLQYLNRIKALGCKLIKSDFEHNNITKVYQGKTVTIIINVLTTRDKHFSSTSSVYSFTILKNLDYMLTFEIEDEYYPVSDTSVVDSSYYDYEP